MECRERGDEVGGVDVVAHLLTAIPEHRVRLTGHRAAHQVGQKPVQPRAGMVGAGQAAAAETDSGQLEVAAVLLHEQIRRRLRDPEQRMSALVDRHRRIDPLVIRVILSQLQTPRQLHQGQLVGQVAVDLVGRTEHERRARRMLARGLQQVQRPVRVDREIRLRVPRRPVVRRLRRGVDHQLDRALLLGEDLRHAVRVADVELERAELGGVALEQRPRRVRGRGVTAKELGAHVVLQTDDVVTRPHEVAHRLRADQPTRSSDYRYGHSIQSFWRLRAPRAADARLKSGGRGLIGGLWQRAGAAPISARDAEIHDPSLMYQTLGIVDSTPSESGIQPPRNRGFDATVGL